MAKDGPVVCVNALDKLPKRQKLWASRPAFRCNLSVGDPVDFGCGLVDCNANGQPQDFVKVRNLSVFVQRVGQLTDGRRAESRRFRVEAKHRAFEGIGRDNWPVCRQ